MEGKGIEETKSSHVFSVNEETNQKSGEQYFSISGTHIVEYGWFRTGHYKTREDADRAIKDLVGNL